MQKMSQPFKLHHLRHFGALTSKPYAFVARPWELRSTLGIDALSGLGSNIIIQSRGNEVLRIQPRNNDDVNEEWIDDKGRFAVDGLKRQRLTRPLCRDPENGKVWDRNMYGWREVFGRINGEVERMMKEREELRIRAVCGSTVDLYSALALTDFVENFQKKYSKSTAEKDFAKVESLGSKSAAYSTKVSENTQNVNVNPADYRFNTTIAGIEEADLCLLIGTNLQVDAPLIVTRLRKGFLRDNLSVYQIGFRNDLTFPSTQLGLGPKTLFEIASNKHKFCDLLSKAKRPMIVIDAGVFNRPDADKIKFALKLLKQNPKFNLIQTNGDQVVWNGINFLHRNCNDVGLLELNKTIPFEPKAEKSTDILYLLNVSTEDLNLEQVKRLREQSKVVIVQHSHGDEVTSLADFVLPGAAYTEKNGIYINMEGRCQESFQAITPPLNAKVDWEILRALSEVLDCKLPYDQEDQLRQRLETVVTGAKPENIGKIVPLKFGSGEGVIELQDNKAKKAETEINLTSDAGPFLPLNVDFHLEGHCVNRASATMAKCSQEFSKLSSNFIEI